MAIGDHFATEAEADTARGRALLHHVFPICPLTFNECTDRCQCFSKGYTLKIRGRLNVKDPITDLWLHTDPGCANAMFDETTISM